MWLFFTATLLISILGLVSLLWLKRWELRTGNMVLAGVRPQAARASRDLFIWIERVLPHLAVVYARRAAAAGESLLHRGAARGLLATEHGLEHVLRSLRGVTEQPRSNKPASMFLREVAEHKKKLVRHKKTQTVERIEE